MKENARQRILEAASSCFAAKGYSATTIADIEAAAGLSPGAGGTYAHFGSKQAILEGVIDAVVDQPDEKLAPAPETLTDAALDGLAELDRHRDLMRLMFHDLDQFPNQMERVVDRLIEGPYRLVAERTATIAPEVDAEAVAALMVGALINFKVIETLAGKRPTDVSEERLASTWAHLYGLIIKDGQP